MKPKEKKKIVESLDQFRRLEVHDKARNVFVMSRRLSDDKVLAAINDKEETIDVSLSCKPKHKQTRAMPNGLHWVFKI